MSGLEPEPEKSGQRRSYESPLRRERAAETRARVLEAAAQLFVRHGYEGTTVARIAAEAGVAVDTVMTTGAKPYLLLEAFRVRAMGEGGPGTLMERSFAEEVFAITDPQVALDVVVDFMTAAHAASAGLWTVIRATAQTDPRVDDVFDELRQSRDASYDLVVDWLVGLGAVPQPEDPAEHRLDSRLALSAEHYHLLTQDCGADEDGYRRQLRASLLAPG